LNDTVFSDREGKIVKPEMKDVKGYEVFSKRYHEGLSIERAAN